MRRKDDDKEKNIKEAVVKLILQEGFHGTSISKIAKLAGVSPATVYIYYENKEIMLHEIYKEYSEDLFDYVLEQVDEKKQSQCLIEDLIRSYYQYICDYSEIYHFVDQFSNCPSLLAGCTAFDSERQINQFLLELKQQKLIRNYSNDVLIAVMFYPVKAIAMDAYKSKQEKELLLDEFITMIQSAIVV